MRRTLLAFIAFLCLCCWAQAQVTTEGTEFWLGFMQNADEAQPSSLEVFFTSKQEANVTVFLYQDGTTHNFTVTPQQTRKQIISASNNNLYAASGSGNIQSKAIRVTSDVPISLYAFNNRQFSGDAAVILPINTLGKKYFASTYYEPHIPGDNFAQGPSQSELLIVAAADDTNINITPKVATTDGKAAGEMFTISLNQGDIYQLQAEDDLTGTLIESSSQNEDDCKNFAVFGGNVWTRVTGDDNCATTNGGASYPGGFAADHLYEQMYPVKTWGKAYTAAPFELRTGFVLRTTASEDNTTVTIGGTTHPLNEGQSVSTFHSSVTAISSDKPIQVAQFSQSLSCDFRVTSGPGDPFMIMLSPNEQQLKEITFNALSATQITDYFVTVLTPTNSTGDLLVDNVPSGGLFQEVPGNSGLSWATLSTTEGRDLTFKSEAGFIAYVYGFGNIESFGYVAGASLENLNLELIGDDETIGLIVQEGCVNSLVNFEVDFEEEPGQDPRFTVFDWDFGDGNVAEGRNVTHTYTAAGEYEITLVASDGGGACGNAETVTRTITITETVVDEVSGPLSVCPDVTNVVYAVTGPADNTYQWFIEGGTITSQITDQITVDWGESRDDAFIKILPTNYLGCVGDTITLDVRINKRLEPLLPQGAAEVCLADIVNVAYSTPQTSGSEYEWFIEGGTILSGTNTNAVEVAWNGVGNGRLWYREFNPDIADCEGFSDPLEVVIYDDVVATGVVTHVSCNAGSDGTISLAISGGKPGNYTVQWDNGMEGPDISGLVAGTYMGTITDEIGCVENITLTVTEPPVLEFVSSNIEDVRCFQESNGLISVDVTGGTPHAGGNYTYLWTGANIANTTTTEPMLGGLPTGDYNLVVTDDKGCEITMDFFVDEPELLEPDLETLINLPICPDADNGTVFIEAKGGTPDYQFFWSNNPTEDQQQGANFSQGTYTVRIVDANGCETSLDVEVTERFPRIFIPNAFSPNGDGENDEFRPVTDCQLTYSIQVFNEWGSVIFSTNDIFEGWDGTLEGENVPDGKYSYIIFYSGSLNGVSFEETLRGTLRIYR